MSNYNREQNMPGGTWQSTWINLINQANQQFIEGKLPEAFTTTRILYVWLPIKCKEDCKTLFEKTVNDYCKIKVTGCDYISQALALRRATYSYLGPRIIPLLTAFQESLERRGWISKGSNLAPRNDDQPHIGEY